MQLYTSFSKSHLPGLLKCFTENSPGSNRPQKTKSYPDSKTISRISSVEVIISYTRRLLKHASLAQGRRRKNETNNVLFKLSNNGLITADSLHECTGNTIVRYRRIIALELKEDIAQSQDI